MFPKDKLFWGLVRRCRELVRNHYFELGSFEMRLYLHAYEWGAWDALSGKFNEN